MSRGVVVLVLLVLVSCARSFAPGHGDPDARGGRPDAGPVQPPTDARRDDAPPDAFGCTKLPQQVLSNASFDDTGGWMQMPADPAFPIIAAAPEGIEAPTVPNVAWFGGAISSTEIMTQDVVVPPGTVRFALTGKVLVSSGQLLFAEDELIVTLRDSGDALIGEIYRWDNRDSDLFFLEWKDFAFAVTAPAAGPVRLHLVALNDATTPTSFFFDNLALIAEFCP